MSVIRLDKQRENAAALEVLPDLLREVDALAPADRLASLVQGVSYSRTQPCTKLMAGPAHRSAVRLAPLAPGLCAVLWARLVTGKWWVLKTLGF